jgi:hypothetical protein
MSGNGGEGLSYKRIREQSLASDSFLQEGAGQVGDGFKKLEQRFMLPPPQIWTASACLSSAAAMTQ